MKWINVFDSDDQMDTFSDRDADRLIDENNDPLAVLLHI